MLALHVYGKFICFFPFFSHVCVFFLLFFISNYSFFVCEFVVDSKEFFLGGFWLKNV